MLRVLAVLAALSLGACQKQLTPPGTPPGDDPGTDGGQTVDQSWPAGWPETGVVIVAPNPEDSAFIPGPKPDEDKAPRWGQAELAANKELLRAVHQRIAQDIEMSVH